MSAVLEVQGLRAGYGTVEVVHGIDTVNHDSDPADDQGHGTHTAGTAAAAGNNFDAPVIRRPGTGLYQTILDTRLRIR